VFCLDFARDHRKTILIVGSGRSGTTWISNLVNFKNEYRDVFEPFHVRHVPLVHHLAYNVYLRPNVLHPEVYSTARLILTGAFQNAWTNRNNRRLIANQRLVKDIRIHHFLKWLTVQFPHMPVVYILRHPLAVIDSRQALQWPARLEMYLERPELVQDYLAPFVEHIERALSFSEQSLERNVFFWCVENYVPLRQFRAGEMHVAFYENFVTEPEREAQRLFQYLNKAYEPRVLDALETPSSQTRADSSVLQKDNKLERWRRTFSAEQIAWTLDTLQLFGLDRIYTDALVPQIENDKVLRAPSVHF
jgi:hypothetical protein